MASSSQKVVLITGCSTGIGLVTAVMLAKDPEKRFKVYATMRNLGKKEALETEGKEVLGSSLLIEQLDVTSEDQINKVVDDILAKEGKLDILVNNAGFGWIGPTEKHGNGNMEAMFATNVYGPIKLIRKLIPVWKKSESGGHALTVTSIGGISGFPFSSVYAATKFAMEGYMESVQLELSNYPKIKMTTIEPGPVVTKFAENAQTGNLDAVVEGVDESSRNTLFSFRDLVMGLFKEMAQQGEDIAKVILEAITSSSPHARYMTNSKYNDILKSRYSDLTGDDLIKRSVGMFFPAKKQ